MAKSNSTRIAGSKTVDDWRAIEPTLQGADAATWDQTLQTYYMKRLQTRYFGPIQALQKDRTLAGEGFSIVAIQCSLIEFLESTLQGKSYRYARKGQKLRAHEYSSSSTMFVSFLINRPPFSNLFNVKAARAFYSAVRCGLLHEASTKNGWRIRATASNGQVADLANKILYRDDFNNALLQFVASYCNQVQQSRELQAAFIRKFNSLCN